MNADNIIIIKGARVHNLKNIDLELLRDQMIVVTGLSGSGKSSLVLDTIYAEGQRRYVESLSSYARQFLGRINKPDVDFIEGIPPAIAIEQRVSTRNPRSTVGTSTEIYDYLKLFFARIGKTYSPKSNKVVKKHSVQDVIKAIKTIGEGRAFMILAPLKISSNIDIKDLLKDLLQRGFSRIYLDKQIFDIGEFLSNGKEVHEEKAVFCVIDRFKIRHNEEEYNRYADSIQMAFIEGDGECVLREIEGSYSEKFSDRFESDGIIFEEPTVHMFSFNNPLGACPLCEGYGKVLGIDPDLVIPDKSLSIYEDAIVCWKGEKMSKWKEKLVLHSDMFDFPIHRPYHSLNEKQKELLWTGNRYFKGLNAFFDHLEKKKYKIQYRVMLSRYRGKTTCPVCKGTRLKPETAYVKVKGKTIQEMVEMPVSTLFEWFSSLSLTRHEQELSGRILLEIRNRLEYMVNVGLGYLTLNRLSSTLSGGESQRINLSTALGSSLVGSLYILDEPSIGLHPRDTHMLIKVLKNLQSIGNTVLVVEHDEEIIMAADEIVDIGPMAGRLGGKLVFKGAQKQLLSAKDSLTGDYISGRKKIPVPDNRRKWNSFIKIKGARENNLKNINVKIPLNVFTVVTGVSGSGKSTLIHSILYQGLNKIINGFGERTGEFDGFEGDIKLIESIEFVDQNLIGKSSRSNPVTYVKAYDEIRKLFASQPMSETNNLKPSHFSFNTEGGRCEECQGEGVIKIEMQFMADVELICDSCHGKRFKDEVLEVNYRGKNISDVLDLTVNEAMEFFSGSQKTPANKIVEKLRPLADVGLGYIKLGQSSSTLSGGESQRVKLASFLGREKGASKILFIFDEPTTGLHFHDIHILIEAFNALIKRGHTILIIEHNLEMIKSADWIVDLGPEGGEEGGHVIFEGIPDDIIRKDNSYTGKFLREKLIKK